MPIGEIRIGLDCIVTGGKISENTECVFRFSVEWAVECQDECFQTQSNPVT